MPTKSCFTCAFRTLNPQECPLIRYSYAADRNQYCPYWSAELPICDRCGQIELNSILSQSSDGTWKRLCKKCESLSGTCGGCSKSTTCDFETNPSPLPKAVQKQVRQGNQILVTTVKNEERIRETCEKNCGCFSQEFGCLRENGTCGNYEGAF